MYGSILEERHFDVDWSPIIEDLYSPELGFMDICVARCLIFCFSFLGLSDAPTPFTVHSSRPLSFESLREGCIPSEGMIAFARDLLKSTHIHLEPPSPRRSAVDPSIRTLSLHVDASKGLRRLYGHILDSTLPLLVSIQIIIPFVLSLYRILIPLLVLSGSDFVHSLDTSSWEALASLRQEIGGQQGRPPIVAQDETPHDLLPPPPPPPIPSAPQASPYVLHGHSEIAPPAIVQTTVADDAHAPSLPAKFKMPDIERYTGIGCPRLHLRLYSTMIRAHGLDESQMITLFPLSLSGAAQRWFASLESSRRWTWGDLAREFLRQFSFNTVVDTFRARSDTDGLEEFTPRIARHVVGVPFADFGSLVMTLYDVEDGISRGLWTDSFPSDIKGMKPFVGPRPTNVSAIGSSSQRPLRRHQPISQFSEPHSSYASHQALRDPRSPTRSQGSHATLLSSPRDLRRLIPDLVPSKLLLRLL
ncbi:hypothetical protein CK203_024662 [Vitis vinifera]|uniref:Retrotransposon gag domain-containing protein n=1 Tax=Vitis vinifera TaxID=29760 RepID=A0A438IUM0_VITVI|nr:hypothetical protein CK203_024662 [Vitis vinifera]